MRVRADLHLELDAGDAIKSAARRFDRRRIRETSAPRISMRLPSAQQLAGPVASRALASLLGASVVLLGDPNHALAAGLSAEQQLAAEAWRVTDREYVDRSFANQDWFQARQKMVKKSYAADRTAVYDEIRAMLASLGDKYTRFLTPSAYDAVFSVATGDVAGIGVELAPVGGGAAPTKPGAPVPPIAITTVFEGAPAEVAGLKEGDVLNDVDSEPLAGLSAEEVARHHRTETVGSRGLLHLRSAICRWRPRCAGRPARSSASA